MQTWAAQRPLRRGLGSAEPGRPQVKPRFPLSRLADPATPKAAPAPGHARQGRQGSVRDPEICSVVTAAPASTRTCRPHLPHPGDRKTTGSAS